MNLPSPSTSAAPAVIDTQSVLDWLYFQNPACAHWEHRRQAGQWRWIASLPMRDELAHVLARGLGDDRWANRSREVLAHFDQHAELLPPPSSPLGAWPRCTDRDDQKFIDLALNASARWLISRDKAVLKLARKAWQLRQVHILRPTDWDPVPLGN